MGSMRFRQFVGGVAPARRASAGQGVVMLTGEITEASSARCCAAIEAAKGDLELVIDSPGGNFGHALQIGAAIQKRTGKTTAIVLRAESAAVIPMAACSSAIMARDGHVTVHEASLHVPATLSNLDAAASTLIYGQRQIADILAARSKSTPSSFFMYLMNANGGQGTRLSPEDCVTYGIADRVSPWPARYLREGRR
jgi:ATP-dependent protease ClpP protease subunit